MLTRSRATQWPACSLLPSPPSSPPRSPTPTLAPAAFSQLALKGEVRAYVPPDHTRGEQFPGKQSPTVQLSLFQAGVRRCGDSGTGVSKK